MTANEDEVEMRYVTCYTHTGNMRSIQSGKLKITIAIALLFLLTNYLNPRTSLEY